jgi:hypothetical protein
MGLVHVDLKTSASKGALPLPLFCIEALGERRRLLALEKEKAGEKLSEFDLVFAAETRGL